MNINLEKKTESNKYYRKVIYTDSKLQLVLMHILPQQEIGTEKHSGVTQFIRIESGNGYAVINGKRSRIKTGTGVVIPPGTKHNIINNSKTKAMQIYTIYTPPEHPPNKIEKFKKVK